MADVEEIAAVPGIDILFFGPGDYSHALGKAFQLDDPEIVAGYQRVAVNCLLPLNRPTQLPAQQLLRLNSPDLRRVSAAQEAARAAGKFAGTVCGAANAQSLADMGYQVLAMGMDAWAVAEWARQVTIHLQARLRRWALRVAAAVCRRRRTLTRSSPLRMGRGCEGGTVGFIARPLSQPRPRPSWASQP